MRNVKATRWFVEPRDAKTNENAMMDLVQSCGATDEKIYRCKKDNEGEEHDVVEVNHAFVARMECSATRFQHSFRVYTQVGGGPMRLWPFGNQTKLGRTTEVKRVKKELTKRSVVKD